MLLRTLAATLRLPLLTSSAFVFVLSSPVPADPQPGDFSLDNPETVLRALVQPRADKDNESLKHSMKKNRRTVDYTSPTSSSHSSRMTTEPPSPDLSGTWEIQEEDKTYYATLDARGNGPYTHEGGRFTTTKLDGRLWSGKWIQTENDREGEFEVLLSEDFLTAEGEWWYLRVGEHTDIPPRLHGGSYFFRKLPERTSLHAPSRP